MADVMALAPRPGPEPVSEITIECVGDGAALVTWHPLRGAAEFGADTQFVIKVNGAPVYHRESVNSAHRATVPIASGDTVRAEAWSGPPGEPADPAARPAEAVCVFPSVTTTTSTTTAATTSTTEAPVVAVAAPPPTLPRTGPAEADVLAPVALVALVAGLVAVAASRRR